MRGDGKPARCILLFDPTDRHLHAFFQAGRYPTGEDLINAHHALKCLGRRPRATDVRRGRGDFARGQDWPQADPGPLQAAWIVREEKGRFILLYQGTIPDDLERMARAYREGRRARLAQAAADGRVRRVTRLPRLLR